MVVRVTTTLSSMPADPLGYDQRQHAIAPLPAVDAVLDANSHRLAWAYARATEVEARQARVQHVAAGRGRSRCSP
jgi:hypothetical protein